MTYQLQSLKELVLQSWQKLFQYEKLTKTDKQIYCKISHSEKCFASPIRILFATAKIYRCFLYLLENYLLHIKFTTVTFQQCLARRKFKSRYLFLISVFSCNLDRHHRETFLLNQVNNSDRDFLILSPILIIYNIIYNYILIIYIYVISHNICQLFIYLSKSLTSR